MKKSDVSVRISGPTGPVKLYLQLTVDRRVQEAWGETDGDPKTQAMMDWLCPWLAGLDMARAYETVAEEYIRAFPEATWTWSQLPQELVRQALYQTHPHVNVVKVDPLICRCHKLTESTLKAALKEHPQSDVQALGLLTKAGTGCGSCRPQLEQLVSQNRPASRRWHGESNAHWGLKVQESLDVWRGRTRLLWVQDKDLKVSAFHDGIVRVRVDGGLTADQEWELSQALGDYWAEGFPADLSLFLDFDLL